MILGRYHALNTLETLWMVRFQICTKTDDFEFCGLLIASMVKNQETNETVILMLEGVGIPGRWTCCAVAAKSALSVVTLTHRFWLFPTEQHSFLNSSYAIMRRNLSVMFTKKRWRVQGRLRISAFFRWTRSINQCDSSAKSTLRPAPRDARFSPTFFLTTLFFKKKHLVPCR